MINWQPIETAPKDGTPILVIVDNKITSGEWEGGTDEFGRWVLHVPSEYPGDNTIHPAYWAVMPEIPND